MKLTKLKTEITFEIEKDGGRGGSFPCAPLGFSNRSTIWFSSLTFTYNANQSLMRSRHLQWFIYRYSFSAVTAAVSVWQYLCMACQHTCVCQAHLVITMCSFNSEFFCHKSLLVTLDHRQWSKLSFSICLSLWIKRIRAVLDISFHLCKYMQISRCYERIGRDPEQLVFLKG